MQKFTVHGKYQMNVFLQNLIGNNCTEVNAEGGKNQVTSLVSGKQQNSCYIA